MNLFNRPSRAFGLLAASAVVALVAGCGSSGGSSSGSGTPVAKHGNTLNWGDNFGDVWVKTLDPATVTDSLSIGMLDLVQANLVKTNYPNLKPEPDLASSWTVSPDHKTWTFHLRPNAKFSNGDPVTAQDAVWSITRSLMPATKSPVALTYLGDIVGAAAVNKGTTKTLAGIKALDAHTVQITLDKPISYFLGTLSYPTGDVLDKKVWAGQTAGSVTNDCSVATVGAGPFKFVCLNNSSSKNSFYPSGHSSYMKFAPNPYYYGAKPTINIYAPFFADGQTLYKAFEAGEVDFAPVPTADLSSAQKKAGFSKVALLDTDYITPNSQMAPFNNIHCRLAVAYAVDRVGVTTKLLRGTEGPLYDVVPPGLLGYFGQQSDVPSYNPSKAKAELAQCPGGLKNVTMTYQHTSEDIDHEYDAIRANLQAIGANITLKPLTFNAWLNIVTQSMNATHTQITENLWIDDYPDSQDWLANLLHTGANYDIGGYSNPTYDKLVDAGDTEFNNAKRAQDYVQAQKLVVNDGGWIGVGYGYQPAVINPYVKGLLNTASGFYPTGNDWSKVTLSK